MKLYFMRVLQISKSPWFKLLLSMTLLAFVFRNINISQIIAHMVSLSLWVSALYVFMMFCVILLLSYRWETLAMPAVSKRATSHFFAATMMGMFYNLFLPSQNGGDFVKWTFVRTLNLTKKRLVFSVFFDRVVGLMGVIVLGSVCFLFSVLVFHAEYARQHWLVFAALFSASIAFIATIVFPRVLKIIPLPYFSALRNQFMAYLSEHRVIVLRAILISIIAQVLFFFAAWQVVQAVGMNLSFLQVVIFGSIVSIFVSLPISLSGFGTTEVAYVYFFTTLGAAKEQVLVFTTMLAAYRIVLAAMGWIIGTSYQSKFLAESPSSR